MQKTKYIWHNGKLVKWAKANTHVLTHALHYGSGVFEGLRLYETKKGPAIFRLKEHSDRLIYSAEAITLKVNMTSEEISQVIIDTAKANKLKSGYIRPLVYFGYGKMGLNPIGAPTDFLIAMWPWGKYLDKEAVDVCISDIIRIHPKSANPHAKITGYYINSIHATLDAKNKGFDEALLLDYQGKIAEGPGENLFLVKGNKLYTPSSSNILPGITRSTVIEISKDLGLEIAEETIDPDFIKECDEAFFSGTAVEITPIAKINDIILSEGKVGKVTQKIKDTYLDCVHGKIEKYNHYLTYVD